MLPISARVYGWRGRGQHLADGADLDQAAGVHHREPMDELRHQSDVVADQYQRRAAFAAAGGRASPSPGAG